MIGRLVLSGRLNAPEKVKQLRLVFVDVAFVKVLVQWRLAVRNNFVEVGMYDEGFSEKAK
jgi:hypothetical protein